MLEPPPPPAATVPAVPRPPTPPNEGMSRLIVDVVDGPAEFQLKQAVPGTSWLRMCDTPCVIDLVPGRYEASFRQGRERGDYTTLDIVAGTNVYRRQLVERTGSPGLMIAGYVIGYTGITTLLMGLMISAFDTRNAGRNTALVGLGMTLGGGAMFYVGWPTEQPAAATHFTIP